MEAIADLKTKYQVKTTDELLTIWKTNDRATYRNEVFNVIKEILADRACDLPPQDSFCCKACGTLLEHDATFCGSCGKAVWDGSEKIEEPPVLGNYIPVESKLKGLGGWLVLVIIGLFGSCLIQAYTILNNIKLFGNGTVSFFSDPSSAIYIPGYSWALKFELIGSILLLLLGAYVIYLLFGTKRKFPQYYVTLLIAGAAFAIMDYIITASLTISHEETKKAFQESLSEESRSIWRSVIGALIWGTYMYKSKRVKATFIED